MFQENGRGKDHTEGRGCGHGLSGLAKEFEFMQLEEVLHGRLNLELKCPMVAENDLAQGAQTAQKME